MLLSGRYDPFRWLKIGGVLLLILVVVSTFVYMALGRYYNRNDWTFVQCLFMVVITLSTIGYGDVLSLKEAPLAEVYTMFLAVTAVGVPAFVISNLTGVIVEGMLGDAFRRRRMGKQIADMSGHIIVCGVGTTGVHIAEELLKTHRPFVCVDRDDARLAKVTQELGLFPYVVGDADDDDILAAAGIARASGLVACLTEDKDNLYITLTARRLNPGLRIVSKVVDDRAEAKLHAAGADRCVNPTFIGGLRLVSELVRPSVVTFLDCMIRDEDTAYRFEELTVESSSRVAGRTLAEANLRQVGDVLVIAFKNLQSERFAYNPKASLRLDPGCTVVFLGRTEDLVRLREFFRAS